MLFPSNELFWLLVRFERSSARFDRPIHFQFFLYNWLEKLYQWVFREDMKQRRWGRLYVYKWGYLVGYGKGLADQAENFWGQLPDNVTDSLVITELE